MKVKKNKALLLIVLLIFLVIIIFTILKPSFIQFNSENVQLILKGKSAFTNYNKLNQKNFDVLHYDLNFNLFPQKNEIKASCIILAKVGELKSKRIVLNFYNNLKIEKVLLNNIKVSFSRDNEHLYIPRNNITKDTISIFIKYSGTPKSLGFGSFNFKHFKKEPVVYTLSEPIFASTWFPCNDIPIDKATADIKITNDSSFVSVSNGKLVDIVSEGGKKTYHWKTAYPISTYLISIFSAKYDRFGQKYISLNKKDTMNIEYFSFPKHTKLAKVDFSINLKVLRYFSSLFGEYPFIKEKYGVAEFLWPLGAMENQTITGIGANFIGGRKFFNDIYIHELAHQWWGDAVTLKTWKDIWLNEGFATYSEALYFEHESGRDALISTMMSKFGEFEGKTLYNPGINLFEKLVYNKGAWVLHMLRRELGDQRFFQVLRNYYKTFKYKNASTEDFKQICENVSKKKLDYFFDQWIYKGKGILKVSYNLASDSLSENKYVNRLNITQVRNGYSVYNFPLDIKFRLQNGESFIKQYRVKTIDTTFTFNSSLRIWDVVPDPASWLLAKFVKKN